MITKEAVVLVMNWQELDEINPSGESLSSEDFSGLSWSQIFQSFYSVAHNNVFSGTLNIKGLNGLNATKENFIVKGLGSYNYQVRNGGHEQWHDNGYLSDYRQYMDAAFNFAKSKITYDDLAILRTVSDIYNVAVAHALEIDKRTDDEYHYAFLEDCNKLFYEINEEDYFKSCVCLVWELRKQYGN